MTPVGGQTVHNVPGDFGTIQEAIEASLDGDTVLVETGTYLENIDFLGKEIRVVSAAGPDVTIIDGSGCTNGVDLCSVVTFQNGELESSILEGFTITSGVGTLVDQATSGGGVFCSQASPTILNCTVIENLASFGGGMTNLDGSPTLIDCLFSVNSATDGSGGGLFSSGTSGPASNPLLINCNFNGNMAKSAGGMANILGTATLINCVFRENTAFVSGDGMGAGGGMMNGLLASATLINCVFSANTSEWRGGGLNNDWGSELVLINCTISANHATVYGGGGLYNGELFGSESHATVTNCIFRENTPTQITNSGSSSSVVSYSNMQGGYAGAANIDTDPRFVAPLDGDFHLLPDSPCINRGNSMVLDLPPEDIDGDERISCELVDMGVRRRDGRGVRGQEAKRPARKSF